MKQTKYFSYCNKDICQGCQLCVKGRKSVLFITGLCSNNCFYCPIGDEKHKHDILQINEIKLDTKGDYIPKIIQEIKTTQSKGVGITGGDPLCVLPRTLKIIKALKKEFRNRFHIHLYTTLTLADVEKIKQLKQAGLDEIRFHLFYQDKDYLKKHDKLFQEILKIKDDKFNIGVEVPILPDKEKELEELIKYLNNKVDFLNLNELEYADNDVNKITDFYEIDANTYQVKGSLDLGKKLLEWADENSINLSIHVCTVKLKNRIQMAERLKLRAETIVQKFGNIDKVTDYGTLLRGVIYSEKLSADIKKQIEKIIGKIYYQESKKRYIVNRKRLTMQNKKVKNILDKLNIKYELATIEEWPIEKEVIFEKDIL